MKHFNQIIFLAILIVFETHQINAKIILEDVKTETNNEYCEVKNDIKHADGKISIAVDTNLKVDLDEHTYISALLSNKFGDKYEPLIRLEPIAFCKYINVEKKPAILRLALMMLKSFGEVPEQCPIKKGKYYVKDIELDDSLMIPMMPSGSFHLEFLVQKKEGNEMKLISKTDIKASIDQPE
uniref:CSON007780 protein n=1 Tax=Culicoides sonorensis TaxID=179676 RepID=A0A336M0P6_CULSO